MITNNIAKLFTFVFLLFSTSYFSQVSGNNFCSHNEEIFSRVKTDPEFKKMIDSIDLVQKNHLDSYVSSLTSATRAGTIYYIPVVYHIVHEGGLENISDAQVKSDLKDLNDIYRKLNTNVSTVNSAFSGISADIEIEFRLAQKKNDGTCFSGITRTNSPATNTGGNSAADAVKAVHGDFPGNKYMNIFIVKSFGTSGVAGYTYKPGFPYQSDMRNGIHVLNSYIGTIGTSIQTGFNTTIAHEAGHWLNLSHLWGNSNSPGISTNCSIDDGIGDTPNTIGWQSCNTAGVTCGTLDNVENIMEYSYCSKMFTAGQKNVMRAAITSSVGGRNNLITVANQTATGIFSDIICNADFESNKSWACENQAIQFTDLSYHNPSSWSWSFPGGTPSTSTLQNPIVTYSTAAKRDVSLIVTNSNGSKSTTKTNFITILPDWGASMPWSEGFETSDTQFKETWQTTTDNQSNILLSNINSSGSKSALIRNFALTKGQEAELVSNSLNLTGNSSVSISFKYAYAKKTTSLGESVQFLITNNCGDIWVIAKGLNVTTANVDSEFVPSTNQWGTQTINISNAFYTSNFRFKIKVKNGDGNNFYIDDININNIVGVDELNSLSAINIYPNPMNETSTISLDLKTESIVSILLFNTIGEIVQTIKSEESISQGNSKIEINRNNLSKGIYFINTIVNGRNTINKLVIN